MEHHVIFLKCTETFASLKNDNYYVLSNPYHFLSSVKHTKKYILKVGKKTTSEPIDFHCVDKFLKISSLMLSRRKSNSFGMTWMWINNERIFLFWLPLAIIVFVGMEKICKYFNAQCSNWPIRMKYISEIKFVNTSIHS